LPWPFKAFDAVPIETPARAATSRIVARLTDLGSGLSAGPLTGQQKTARWAAEGWQAKGCSVGPCPGLVDREM